MKNRLNVFVIGAIISFLVSGTAYAKGPFVKLGRGLTNVVLSPAELMYQPLKLNADVDNNRYVSWLGGIPKGLFFFPIRLLAGVYDIVTFLIPVPGRYDSIIRPETLIEGFETVPIP